jgi:hypothetical protein
MVPMANPRAGLAEMPEVLVRYVGLAADAGGSMAATDWFAMTRTPDKSQQGPETLV